MRPNTDARAPLALDSGWLEITLTTSTESSCNCVVTDPIWAYVIVCLRDKDKLSRRRPGVTSRTTSTESSCNCKMITGHHVACAFSALPLAFGSGSGPSSGMSWYSRSMDLSYWEFERLNPIACTVLDSRKVSPLDGLFRDHIRFWFLAASTPWLHVLKGLKKKKKKYSLYSAIPTWLILPIGHGDILKKIAWSQPKTLQESTAATRKFVQQHLRSSKTARPKYSMSNRNPIAAGQPQEPACKTADSRSSWHSSLSTRWCALDLAWLSSHCLPHARHMPSFRIRSWMLFFSSWVGSTALTPSSRQTPFISISSMRLVPFSADCAGCSTWCLSPQQWGQGPHAEMPNDSGRHTYPKQAMVGWSSWPCASNPFKRMSFGTASVHVGSVIIGSTYINHFGSKTWEHLQTDPGDGINKNLNT